MIGADAAALLTCAAFSGLSWHLKPAISIFSPGWLLLFSVIRFIDEVSSTAAKLSPLLIFYVTVICFFVYCLYRSLLPRDSTKAAECFENSTKRYDANHALKPLLFPARTTHTRFFPQKHSFSYSYLLVGVPVGWRGVVRSYLSVDLPVISSASWQGFRRSWFSVNAEDYLVRGGEHLGLQGKLHSYLESQGEIIDDYPYAYLVTAPRFFGYSFNPVSFWYLYSDHKDLIAMILEVNNTFDERRLYFLKGTPSTEEQESSADTPCGRFKDTWPKDFHVSPFNSRKGSYALNAIDPFSPHLSGPGIIDNTITLSSSKAHAKLVARVFSTEAGSDPETLGYWSGLRFIATWWWVGFVTFPRIAKEAGALFFRRKLHVWYRPEVLKDSIGRRATKEESIIGSSFRGLLKNLVASSNLVQSIKYTSSIPSSPTHEYFTSTTDNLPNSKETVEFKILTPLFFTRLARHSHISEFLSNEILTNDDKNRTFHTSHPHLLLQLFKTATTPARAPTRNPSFSNRLGWRRLLWLRSRRRRPQVTQHEQQQVETTDIRHLGYSQLDHHVMEHESQAQGAEYTQVVTKILLSDIVAFGYPGILDAVLFILRVLGSYFLVIALRDCWRQVLGEDWTTVSVCHKGQDDAWCDWGMGVE